MLSVVLCPGTPEGSTGSSSGFKAFGFHSLCAGSCKLAFQNKYY